MSEGKKQKAQKYRFDILIFNCIIIQTTSFFQHLIRGSLNQMAAVLQLPLYSASKVKILMSALYAPGILFSLLGGQVIDIFGDFIGLLIFSSLCFLGSLLMQISIYNNKEFAWYLVSMLVFGTGQMLIRIPQKKMISNSFQGKYLAVALNICHNASHLSGFLGGFVMTFLIENIERRLLFLIISVYTLLGVVSVFLCRDSLLSNEKKITTRKSLKSLLFQVLKESPAQFFELALVGILMDSVVVSYKNIESIFLFDNCREGNRAKINTAISWCKGLNFLGPFISYGMDIFPFFNLYMLSVCVVLLSLLVYFSYIASANQFVSMNVLVVCAMFYRITMVFFYSSWYPAMARILKKETMGTAFGLVFTFNNAGFVINLLITGWIEKRNVALYLLSVIFVATIFHIIFMIKNYYFSKVVADRGLEVKGE